MVGVRQLEQISILECAFADDVVIMASTDNGLQTNLNKWNNIRRKIGIKMKKRKTKVMTTAKYQTRKIMY